MKREFANWTESGSLWEGFEKGKRMGECRYTIISKIKQQRNKTKTKPHLGGSKIALCLPPSP